MRCRDKRGARAGIFQLGGFIHRAEGINNATGGNYTRPLRIRVLIRAPFKRAADLPPPCAAPRRGGPIWQMSRDKGQLLRVPSGH